MPSGRAPRPASTIRRRSLARGALQDPKAPLERRRSPTRRDAPRAGARRPPHRAAGLAAVLRPARGAGLQHRRHGDDRALFGARPRGAGGRSAAYITVFVGFMGVVLAVGPIAGQLFGAGKRARPGGSCTRRCGWRSRCRLIGSTLLLFPQPFLALVARHGGSPTRCAATCGARAVAAVGAAVHRLPRLQHRRVAAEGGDGAAVRRAALKVPLNALLVFGSHATRAAAHAAARRRRLRHRHRIVMGCQRSRLAVLRRDPFYARFGLRGRGMHAPDRASLRRPAAASASRWGCRSASR